MQLHIFFGPSYKGTWENNELFQHNTNFYLWKPSNQMGVVWIQRQGCFRIVGARNSLGLVNGKYGIF